MADPISATISVLALSISAVTAWLTLGRRGTVKMTQPTVIFFDPTRALQRGSAPEGFSPISPVCDLKAGGVIESMYVALSRNESRQNFNIWVYGNEKLVRGSGLFVGETGVEANHHFLIPRDGNHFRFTEGRYRMDVFAKLLGDHDQSLLFSQTLEISRETAILLEKPDAGLYFDWGPDSSRYLHYVDRRPAPPNPEEFLDLLRLARHQGTADEQPRLDGVKYPQDDDSDG